MRCPNCQTVNPANAKFCLECGNRLVVCPNCATINLPMAKFCIECGTPLQAAAGEASRPLNVGGKTEPLTVVEDVRPSALLRPPDERRVVTIMFADITGSTPLADRLEPEDMRAILTGYFNLMAEQIRKHGGTVEKYIGDAVMAIFGIPAAHEDDPERAIRAALDMQQALNQFNETRLGQDPESRQLQMRIGINTGEVAAPGNVHQRQDFLITGDAVNVAARLQQAATPDTILVSERTYLSTRDTFEFRAIAPLHVKGKTEPIAARVALRLRQKTPIITQHPRGIEGRQAPLVGRALELMLLHTSYARVQAERRPHLVTILGAPGVGKSRLIRDFIARELESAKSASSIGSPASPRVLSGRCPPYGEGITYWPLIEILRSLLGVRTSESDAHLQQTFREFVRQTLARVGSSESADEIAGSILRRIGRGLGQRTGDLSLEMPLESQPGASVKQNGTQVALLRAWRVLLEALAEQQPLIIVIDDLQWADEALLEFLEYLTERITSEPILFLCPARPDFFERRRDWGGGKRNFTIIELEALSREESSDLVDALLDTNDLPEVLRQTILARSEGNPFFVEEIVRMLIDQGILVHCEDETGKGTCWRFGPYSELLGELSTPGEYPEDSLLNMHYLLPLPRLPDTIQGVLAARVDLLSPTEKLVLQHAAIVGRTFWLSSVLELATDLDTETAMAALVSLIQRDFIFDTDKQVRSPAEQDRTFIFKHVLIRDVVYNNIPRQRRAQEHAHLALWLEKQVADQREAFIELLAYHFQQTLTYWPISPVMNTLEVNAGATIRLTRSELQQRAITYLTLAGDQAMHSYYTVRAIQAYNDALDLLSGSDTAPLERFKMHIKLGDAYAQRHSEEEALEEYRLALRLTKEAQFPLQTKDLLMLYERLAMRATRWTGHLVDIDLQEIRSYIDAGLELLPGNEISRERVAFLTYQSLWYIRQFAASANRTLKVELAERGLESGQQALSMAEKLQDPNTLSLVLDTMGFLYRTMHKYNEELVLQYRRLQLESQLTDRQELYDIYSSLGTAQEQVGDYANSLMWFGRAWSIAQT
ncbi:MAG: AAA family ATPase, partial [Ktedonobacteraceae bacterium]|nr:AAA family ATPase [Ktedonobacteraceae bacterium]